MTYFRAVCTAVLVALVLCAADVISRTSTSRFVVVSSDGLATQLCDDGLRYPDSPLPITDRLQADRTSSDLNAVSLSHLADGRKASADVEPKAGDEVVGAIELAGDIELYTFALSTPHRIVVQASVPVRASMTLPAVMIFDQPVTAVVRLTRADIEHLLTGRDTSSIPLTLLSQYVSVSLAASQRDFTIRALSSTDQLIIDQCVFLYEVIPKRPGRHPVRVILASRIKLPDGEERVEQVLQASMVDVRDDKLKRLTAGLIGHWQLILAVAPGVYWAIYRRRNARRRIGF